MPVFADLALSTIFMILSLIHFYWFFGGKWGLDAVFPVLEEGKNSFEPPRFATLIVALGLLFFAGYYFSIFDFLHTSYSKLSTVISWIIPSIFLVRAIGDFKYVGFFKKVKNSKFASMDSKFYSPLCLIIAVLGFCKVYFSWFDQQLVVF